MAAKYNFSAIRFNCLKGYQEEFQVVNCDSFEEARRIVEKAVHDRELFEAEEFNKLPNAGLAAAIPGPASTLSRPVAPAHPQQSAPSSAVSTTPNPSAGNPQN